MGDMVNHPLHYQADGMEVIDVIESFGDVKAFCKGNVIKYVLRAGKKGDTVEDLKKAMWYLMKWAELEEREEVDCETLWAYKKQLYSDILELCESYDCDKLKDEVAPFIDSAMEGLTLLKYEKELRDDE